MRLLLSLLTGHTRSASPEPPPLLKGPREEKWNFGQGARHRRRRCRREYLAEALQKDDGDALGKYLHYVERWPSDANRGLGRWRRILVKYLFFNMAPNMATDNGEGKSSTGIRRQTPQLAHGQQIYRLFKFLYTCSSLYVFMIFYIQFCNEPPFIFILTRQSFYKFVFLNFHYLRQTAFNEEMSQGARTDPGARPCSHKWAAVSHLRGIAHRHRQGFLQMTSVF